MADDKSKTQIGTPARSARQTGSQTPVAAAGTPAPVPPGASFSGGGVNPPPSASGQIKTSYLPATDDPLLGKKVADRYLVQKKLGEGGMGSVYLATHTVLEKQVALKVLHGEFARKPDLVERFMGEAKAASRIRHENVIDISDFGTTPEGLVFFAMELLTGHDLHEEVARAKLSGHLLPWARTKKIFLQICAALSAAHGKGIVHRDLKPENIYLVDFLDDHDFVKLLDFGIAKMTEVNEEGARKLTKTGMLFGTPEYMSPEQARGEHVDHRVDIYAMGCILFQLITCRLPFEADNFMGVLSMHLTEQPPMIPPEVFDMIGAPRALAEVIDRALVKDKTQRYQTIDELANAVRVACGDRAQTDRPVSNRPASVPAPATTTRARSPSAVVQPIVQPVAREGTGRTRTEWTGSLHVPEVEQAAEQAGRRSKMPIVIAAFVVIVGGGITAAIVASRGGGDGGAGSGSQIASGAGSAAVGSAPGSAVGGAAGSAGSAVEPPQPPPPPPPQEPPLPDMAKLDLDSTPQGATVTDLTTGKPIGKTPVHYSLPGSKTPRQFSFHLRGFSDTTVELVPNRATIGYVETLQKGAAGTVVVHKVPDPQIKPLPEVGSGGGVITRPDTGSATVKPPETGSAAKPPETGSATKPPETGSAKPKPDCADDELPCLKGMPMQPGAGSAP